MSPMILLLGTGAEGGTPNPFLVMVPYVFILFIFYFHHHLSTVRTA